MYHFTEKPSIKTLKTIFQVPLSQHKTVTTQPTGRAESLSGSVMGPMYSGMLRWANTVNTNNTVFYIQTSYSRPCFHTLIVL